MNSAAAALMDFKSAKSNCKKMASLPVCSFNSSMADFAFCSLRAATYTLALCVSNTCRFYNVKDMDVVGVDVDLPSPFLFQFL